MDSGASITSGLSNIAIGASVMNASSGVTGNRNIAIGSHTLDRLTTGADNVAVGTSVMSLSAVLGSKNVAFGLNSLDSITTGDNNVAIGINTLDRLNTGNNNCALGSNAATDLVLGFRNISIGNTSMSGITGSSSFNDNIAIGTNTLNGTNINNFSNTVSIGKDATVTGSNQVQLGNSFTTTYAYGSVQNRSDMRDKSDIKPTSLGLDFINKLKPVEYKWDYRESYGNGERDGSQKRLRPHQGLIAQDIKQVMDELSVDFGGYQDHKIAGGKDVLTVGYTEFIAPLIKSVQELTALNQQLSARIVELESKV
jgi:hypothetical protein